MDLAWERGATSASAAMGATGKRWTTVDLSDYLPRKEVSTNLYRGVGQVHLLIIINKIDSYCCTLAKG